MKKFYLLFFIMSLFLIVSVVLHRDNANAAGGPSPCIKDPINLNVEKRLLPLPAECPVYGYCGRGEQVSGEYAPSPACATPTQIVMHTTQGILTAEGTYDYFAGGSGGRHVGSHFVVGQDGKVLQMVEMGATQVEYAQAVGPIDDAISIEMGAPGNYGSKGEAPEAQYNATLSLVKSLMETYNIPLERVVSHASLGGPGGDPGEGWMADFKKDLPNATGTPGTGTGSTSGGGGTASATSQTCVTKVGDPTQPSPGPLGCTGGSSTSGGTGGGLPGQPLPSSDTNQIKSTLCEQYKVCPTESPSNPPSQPWSLGELTALWNVTQRIASSTTYKNIVIGSGTVEIQRIQHCPNCSGWVQGLQAGTGTGGSTISGSSLIYITDNAGADKGYPTTYLEWLYAHEIGHIAQFASSSSFNSVSACNQWVSAYGRDNGDGENFADSVSFYMTNGESAQAYFGDNANLKVDFPCIYNALKDNAFGGVEY